MRTPPAATGAVDLLGILRTEQRGRAPQRSSRPRSAPDAALSASTSSVPTGTPSSSVAPSGGSSPRDGAASAFASLTPTFSFDFFIDVGCFQGLSRQQRLAQGRGVAALARPGATLLLLAFQRTRLRSLVGGVSQADVEIALAGWELLSVEPAETTGLGWPLTQTAPQWYRLRRH